MLLEFRCANHRSIRDEIIFSAMAGSEEGHAAHYRTVDRLRVLRSAVLYGPNGSGKSNLLDAIAALRARVIGLPVAQTPHKLAEGEPSRYAMQFLVDETRYAYGLSVCGDTILEEYLYTFPRGRRSCLFERTNDTVSTGDRYAARIRTLAADCTPSLPLLALPGAEDIPPLDAVRHFFADTLVPFHLSDNGDDEAMLDEAIAILQSDAETRSAVCTILRMLGTGIDDIAAADNTAYCDYGSFKTDLRREESTGIRRLVSFLCPLVDHLRDGRVLLCNEPEANLHETVVHALLDTLRQAHPDSRAQLIFTTHSTALLDLELFRRDQIWFTELRPADRSTDLYSLVEFRDISRGENIRRGYLTGKYGGIPMLDRDFVRIFGEEVAGRG